MPGTSLEGHIYVPIYPTSLTFFLPDKTTHKQVLTIANPNDFHIDYRILTNALTKYHINNSSGSLRPQHKIEIDITHSYPVLTNVGALGDALRVQIFKRGREEILGQRHIGMTLLNEFPEENFKLEKHSFEELPQRQRHGSSVPPKQQSLGQEQVRDKSDQLILLFLLAGICLIVAVCLPYKGTEGLSWVPTILHVSVEVKIMAAAIFGYLGKTIAVTM